MTSCSLLSSLLITVIMSLSRVSSFDPVASQCDRELGHGADVYRTGYEQEVLCLLLDLRHGLCVLKEMRYTYRLNLFLALKDSNFCRTLDFRISQTLGRRADRAPTLLGLRAAPSFG